MARKQPYAQRLMLAMENGFTDTGNLIVRRFGFAVQPEADIEQLYLVANTFADLCELDLSEATLIENSYLRPSPQS
ncbi:hypothetical protein JCM19046_3354 [Bacillus sp. JCM 19046]|uniref:DUF1659 domain-containing protein n=1 Tax=Shouchella xiaoxiensis TaxID=766895 RepID=A0ABS2T097_9BACI|nr:DUF1659 domain-containing protein [Shouchella xiaoxiensis]MBM7839907.1 hypothetical protein [Shouchella xiaoxiensis]GAF11725.1 hypothetical protein JCM19045_850 [Bacillus sp. JCM 19045]GAF18763.1 hypothetical protein JCM19046_3354 [Bacillus sp. JCM 19046]